MGALASSDLGVTISRPFAELAQKNACLSPSGFLRLPSPKETSVGTDGPVSVSLCDIDVNSEGRRHVSWFENRRASGMHEVRPRLWPCQAGGWAFLNPALTGWLSPPLCEAECWSAT